jgi:hypothetical protein
VSPKGSPGASTVAKEVADRWPREIVGLELDPSGGSWALRHELSWDPGIVSLASTPGLMSMELALEHGARVGRNGVVICSSPRGEQVRAALELLEPRLAAWPAEFDGLVDIGRYDPVMRGVLSLCTETVVVSRTRPEDIGQLERLAETLRTANIDAGLLLIGSEPPFYSAQEIADTVRMRRIDVEIPFATHKRSRKSPYDRAFEMLVDRLARRSASATPVTSRMLAEYAREKDERR